MSLLIVVVIVYGFSFTIGKNLIHPSVPRPWILYVHACVFSSWLFFFVLQSTLVRSRKVQWHRQLGRYGVGLGTLIPIVGVSTAIVMGRFNVVALHAKDAEPSLIIPLFDMVCFTSTFPLAVHFRKNPELHRRLMLVATCVLTAAGFGRFPEHILPPQVILCRRGFSNSAGRGTRPDCRSHREQRLPVRTPSIHCWPDNSDLCCLSQRAVLAENCACHDCLVFRLLTGLWDRACGPAQ